MIKRLKLSKSALNNRCKLDYFILIAWNFLVKAS